MAHAIAVDYAASAVQNMTAVASIGLAAWTLSVFNFLPIGPLNELFMGWTLVRVGIAINQFEGMAADGDAPDVRLWTEDGNFTGMGLDLGQIGEGSFGDIYVIQSQFSDFRPTYALFTGNPNAVCISYVQQTWAADSTEEYAWVGNWGRTCDKEW